MCRCCPCVRARADMHTKQNHHLILACFFSPGDTKSEETTHKEAGEEKPEEDNDYHRSDEQVEPSCSV